MTPNSDSVVKRGALTTAGALIQGAVRLSTTVAIGRLGGPYVLGVFSTAFSTAQLFSLLGPSSIGSAGAKFIARARGKGDLAEASAVASYLSKRALQSSFLLALLTVIAWVLIEGAALVDALPVAALVVGLAGYNFTRGVQFGAGLFARATMTDVITGLAGLVGVIIGLLLGLRGVAILYPLALAYISYSILGWPWGVKEKISPALRREIDGFVGIAIVGTLASAGFLNMSVIVTRLTGGAAEAGQYAAALALATPPALLAAAVSMVIFPSMSEAWGRGDFESFVSRTDRALSLLIGTMFAVFGALILCSSLAVQLIWGDEFVMAAIVLPILLLAVMMGTIGVACTNSLTSRSQRGMIISGISSLGGMAMGTLAWLVLAPAFGARGVALGYLLGTTLITGVPLVVVWRKDGHHWCGLMVRSIVGLGLIAGLMALQRLLALGIWWEPAFALMFLLIWSSLMYRSVTSSLKVADPNRSEGAAR